MTHTHTSFMICKSGCRKKLSSLVKFKEFTIHIFACPKLKCHFIFFFWVSASSSLIVNNGKRKSEKLEYLAFVISHPLLFHSFFYLVVDVDSFALPTSSNDATYSPDLQHRSRQQQAHHCRSYVYHYLLISCFSSLLFVGLSNQLKLLSPTTSVPPFLLSFSL